MTSSTPWLPDALLMGNDELVDVVEGGEGGQRHGAVQTVVVAHQLSVVPDVRDVHGGRQFPWQHRDPALWGRKGSLISPRTDRLTDRQAHRQTDTYTHTHGRTHTHTHTRTRAHTHTHTHRGTHTQSCTNTK